MALYGLGNDRADIIPGTCDFADDDDDVWRQTGDEQRDASAEIIRHLPQGFLRLCITLLCQSKEIVKPRNLSR